MCGIWHAKSPHSSKSSIRHSTAILAPPPVNEGASGTAVDSATVGALGLEPYARDPTSRGLHRGDTYTTAGEIFQSPENHILPEIEITNSAATPPPERVFAEETYDDEIRIGRQETAVLQLQPPNAPHVKTSCLVLSISLLIQVCVISVEKSIR
jgi:hypothetical protein